VHGEGACWRRYLPEMRVVQRGQTSRRSYAYGMVTRRANPGSSIHPKHPACPAVHVDHSWVPKKEMDAVMAGVVVVCHSGQRMLSSLLLLILLPHSSSHTFSPYIRPSCIVASPFRRRTFPHVLCSTLRLASQLAQPTELAALSLLCLLCAANLQQHSVLCC
jgi:hypothetical protein